MAKKNTRKVTAWVEVMLELNIPTDADVEEVINELEYDFTSTDKSVEVAGMVMGDINVSRDPGAKDKEDEELEEPADEEEEEPTELGEPAEPEEPEESTKRKSGENKMDAAINEATATQVRGKGQNTRGTSDYPEIEDMIDALLKEDGIPESEIKFYYDRMLAEKRRKGKGD